MNGKNGDNGRIVTDHVSMVSVLENENAVQVHQPNVMDPNVTWKFVTKMFVMIGQQKVGLTGVPGVTAPSHVVVASESVDESVKTLITIAMIPGLWF